MIGINMKLEDIEYDPDMPALFYDEDFNPVPPGDPKAEYAEQKRDIDGILRNIKFNLKSKKMDPIQKYALKESKKSSTHPDIIEEWMRTRMAY